MPTDDVKQALSLKDVAPLELHLIAAVVVRSNATELEVGEAGLAPDDKRGAADPMLIQQPVGIDGRLPVVMELESLPRASHTLGEPCASQLLSRLRPLGNFEWREQRPSRLGVDAMPYATLAPRPPKVTTMSIRVPVVHCIPKMSTIAIPDASCTTVTTLTQMM